MEAELSQDFLGTVGWKWRKMLIETRGCSDRQDGARKLLESMVALARLLAHNAWTIARRETLSGKFSEKQLGSRCSSACLWEHSGMSAADKWVSARKCLQRVADFSCCGPDRDAVTILLPLYFRLMEPKRSKRLYRPFVERELCFFLFWKRQWARARAAFRTEFWAATGNAVSSCR